MQWTHLHGFSLVEALIVIALLALLGALAIPSLSELVERNRALVVADQLQSHLAHARATSIARNQDVEICGSSDGELCDGRWQQGWLLYIPGRNEVVSYYPLHDRERLRWSGFSRTIRFRGNGTAHASNGRFYICDGAEQVVWQLVVNRQGRVRRLPGVGAVSSGCE